MHYSIDITGTAALVKPPGVTQLLESALDVSGIDEIDLQLVGMVDSLSDFRVDLLTSMDNTSESGWKRVVRFDNPEPTKSTFWTQKRTARNLLRYVRWEATATGSGTANFTLQGIARKSKRGSRFVPTDLADLTLWMDASQVLQLDNTNVSTWSDLSANGNSAVQSNVNFQPVFERSVTSVGGRPGVKFDGVDDSLTCEYGDTLGDLSVYLVFQTYGTPNWTYERFLGKNFAAGLWVGREATTANRIGGGVLQSGAPFGIYDNGFTDGTVHVLGLERNGTTARLYKANTELQTATVSNALTSNQAYVLGAEYNAGYGSWGRAYLFEIVVCARALTTEDRSRLIGYLNRKWGI